MCISRKKRRSLQRIIPPYPFVHQPWRGKEEASHVDIVIVGATISSLYLSLLLRTHGISVLIVEERSFVGESHFLRGVGIGSLGLVDNVWRLTSALGFEETQKVMRFSHHSLSLFKKQTSHKGGGGFHLAKGEREKEELYESHLLLKKMDIHSTFLTQKDLNEEIRKHHVGGLFLESESICNPEHLIQELLQKVQECGVILSLSSKVDRIDEKNEHMVVHHKTDTSCEILIYAHSCDLYRLESFFEHTQTRLRTQAIALPLPEAPSPYSFSSQYGYLYWRDWNDMRIFGGCRWASPHLETGETDETIIHPKIETALLKTAQNLFPRIQKTILFRWSRIELHSCDSLPLVGPLPGRGDKLAMTSLLGRDIGLGFACAQSICNLITEGKSNLLPSCFLPRRLL